MRDGFKSIGGGGWTMRVLREGGGSDGGEAGWAD